MSKINFDEKQFNKELELVQKACKSHEGERELTEYLKPLVESESVNYLGDYQEQKKLDLSGITEEYVIKAGWKHLRLALKTYTNRVEKMKTGESHVHCFTPYFTWFVRQGVLEYIRMNIDINEFRAEN